MLSSGWRIRMLSVVGACCPLQACLAILPVVQARRSIAEKSVGKMKLLSQLFACHFDTAWRILVELRMSQVPAGEPVLRQGHPCKEIVFLLQVTIPSVVQRAHDPFSVTRGIV